jgi:rubredoxin
VNSGTIRKCDFCGYEFTESEAQGACASCPISSCDKLRCPNCGYEYLPEPGFITFLKNRKKRKEAKK